MGTTTTTNSLVRLIRCLTPPTVPFRRVSSPTSSPSSTLSSSLNSVDVPTKEYLSVVFMNDRLAAVEHFLNSWSSTMRATDDAVVRGQLSIVLGWILHDGVRSIWKQLYELQRRQLHLTWSNLYDLTDVEEDNMIMNVEKNAHVDIHVVVQYWFSVLHKLLENVDSSALCGSAHSHCDIIKPLMAGMFGFDGAKMQDHEAKKGGMYCEHDEPCKLNVMVHAKVARVIDTAMGELKIQVREWVEKLDDGVGGTSLNSYRTKLKS